jgi:glycosyltransferase involved in cell wall biosynthesis
MKILMFIILGVWIQRYLRALFLFRKNPLAGEELRKPIENPPRVTVILAARNEEANIERCLTSLSRQRYDNYEIIAADDRSTDSTARIIRGKFPRVRYVKISSLPDEYSGKSHAIYQAQKRAHGEWLLFTDADTIHSEYSILAPLTYALKHNVDMLSLIPEPITIGFWEKVIQPFMGLTLFLLFQPERINRPGTKSAFGVGQYILIHREAYARIGGHKRLLGFPFEDIAMAQNAKKHNLRYTFMFSDSVYKSRMYGSFSEIWEGWERIFFLIFSGRIWMLPLIISTVLLLSLLPYIAVFYYPLLGALQLLFLHLAMERSYRFVRADRRYIFTNPLGCFILVSVLGSAFIKKILRKGVTWRGKHYYEWASCDKRLSPEKAPPAM